MEDIAGFPSFAIELTKKGEIFSQSQVDGLLQDVGPGRDSPTDLLVLSHGWNNDMQEARELYATLLGNLARVVRGENRKIAVLILFWPSKKFADQDLIAASGEPRLASAVPSGRDLEDEPLADRLDSLRGFFDNDDEDLFGKLRASIKSLEDSKAAQKQFVEGLRVLVDEGDDGEDDGSTAFFSLQGDELLAKLVPPLRIRSEEAHGGATSLGGQEPDQSAEAGSAAGLASSFAGLKAAAWRLLNYATYYQMKARAGLVGLGLNRILGRVRQLRPDIRIHLVGHSFGARVVTAATDGPVNFKPSSLVLLQGAYSHHGLSSKFDGRTDGVFHAVITANKVEGPIAITHTVNDKAVGVAYAIASRISGDNRASFGGPDDPFGGIGRNGAVRLSPERVITGKLLAPGSLHKLQKGKVANLRADGFISSHGDVANRAVASLVAEAIS